MIKKDHKPPRWADKFLQWYCRPDMLEDLQGALYEYYYQRSQAGSPLKAKWVFMLDVLAHLRPHTIKRKSQNSTIMINSHFKVSLRNIWKNKFSSTLNTIGLVSGITSFILIFLWVNLELSFDRFHEKHDRIYRICNTFKSESETFSQAVSGPALGGELHNLFSKVESATRFYATSERIQIGEQYFFESGLGLADPTFLDIFSFEVITGDKKTALVDPKSIVLTESTAEKFFGDKNPVGETLTIGTIPVQVTAVIADPPENSQLDFKALIPLKIIEPLWGISGYEDNWGGGWFYTYLLLEEGADPIQLQNEITAFIGDRLTDWAEQGMYYEYFLQPLEKIHLESNLRYDFNNGDFQRVNIFLAAAILILLLACINYVNLSTANAINRSKEVGVRKVIGATRSQLITQYLVEAFIIVTVSCILATVFSKLLLPFFGKITGYEQVKLLTTSNLLYALGLITALSLLAGSLPAYLISKVSSLKVIKGNLKSGQQYNLLRRGLVVTQFAATLTLLISILVIDEQMSFIQNKNLGMKSENVIHINFRGAGEVSNKATILKEKLLGLSTINNVSFLRNSYPVNGLSNSTVSVENGDGDRVVSSIYTFRVDEDFASTLGMEMLSGRFYSKDFPQDTLVSVVVNEACIQSFGWKDAEDAIGKRFGEEPNERKVIGVVKNFNFEGLHKQIEPARIVPVRDQAYTTLVLSGDLSNPSALFAQIEQIWDEVNPTVPLDATFMSDDLNRQYKAEFNFRTIFTAFALISVIIGCLGLLGLATATANQRLREVSIRKVLGASVIEIVTLFNKGFVKLILIASFIGSPLAYYFMSNWLENFTYRISFNWYFPALALAGMLVITILTISIKAFKTAITNPANVLKDE